MCVNYQELIEKRTGFYTPEESAVFDAVYSVTGNSLLISGCQDIITMLNNSGFKLERMGGNKMKTEKKQIMKKPIETITQIVSEINLAAKLCNDAHLVNLFNDWAKRLESINNG